MRGRQKKEQTRQVSRDRSEELDKSPAKEHVRDIPEWKKRLKLFNRWSMSDVKVRDMGLRNQINIEPTIVPTTGGRYTNNQFHRSKMCIVERFINKLMVPGHRGKKHKLTSKHMPGSTISLLASVREAFEMIEKKTSENPIQVLVNAVENSAPLEEVASYRMGGIIARKAVVVAPQRRLDIALKHMAQGIQQSSFSAKGSLSSVIATELIAAYSNDSKALPIRERQRIEKEAEGAR